MNRKEFAAPSTLGRLDRQARWTRGLAERMPDGIPPALAELIAEELEDICASLQSA